ncbi:MAG: ankyrin repeat domain-containing protein [Rickettsiales bacterium]|nr:ankyrin repeat domain-containing protein [Rickettsiales bacterium]
MKKNESQLFDAIKSKDTKKAINLIKSVDNINIKNEYGKDPLQLAIKYDNQDIIETLLENGIDANAKDDSYGRTALHMLAKKN